MGVLVTVKTFYNPNEWGILCGRLESEGILCFVKDEAMAQTGYYSGAVGGIKLQVREEDLENAVQILFDGGYLTEEDLKPIEPSKVEVWLYNLFHREKK